MDNNLLKIEQHLSNHLYAQHGHCSLKLAMDTIVKVVGPELFNLIQAKEILAQLDGL